VAFKVRGPQCSGVSSERQRSLTSASFAAAPPCSHCRPAHSGLTAGLREACVDLSPRWGRALLDAAARREGRGVLRDSRDVYRFAQAAAKTALRAVPSRCAAIRCWLACCAACAARPWCVSWEWDLDSGACALSELGTRPSVGPPTFSAVVGTVQPLLASEAQAFRWVEGGL